MAPFLEIRNTCQAASLWYAGQSLLSSTSFSASLFQAPGICTTPLPWITPRPGAGSSLKLLRNHPVLAKHTQLLTLPCPLSHENHSKGYDQPSVHSAHSFYLLADPGTSLCGPAWCGMPPVLRNCESQNIFSAAINSWSVDLKKNKIQGSF